MGETLLLLIVGAALVFVLLLLGARYSAYDVRVVRETIVSAGVPTAFDGTRIVFLADVHAGRFFGHARMEALVDLVLEQEPSLIVLGGDYVGGRAAGADVFYPHAARLSAPLGVFAVLGNHDAWEGESHARAGLAEAGIRLLENEAVRIEGADASGPAIVVAGLADEWTGSPDVSAVVGEVRPGDFGVLVAHNPDSFDDALVEGSPWRLGLAGHTHGGQVRGANTVMPHSPVRRGSPYWSGWTRVDGTDVLVSNGVGVVTLPLRAFRPAQVHVITLRSGPEGGLTTIAST